MNKDTLVHISNEKNSARKMSTFDSVMMRWMNLEPTPQSEVSQKRKNKYCISTHISLRTKLEEGMEFQLSYFKS